MREVGTSGSRGQGIKKIIKINTTDNFLLDISKYAKLC
jgi:hypothetical protein